ncbi:MAG: hypothetical protein AVDCRST_MAG59-1134, partial [uncultured Thermomicrobiales bacterium]
CPPGDCPETAATSSPPCWRWRGPRCPAARAARTPSPR